MSKQPNFFCGDCGNEYNKWQGQCSGCKAWNTIKEFKESKISGSKTVKKGSDLSFEKKIERTVGYTRSNECWV